MTDHFATSQGSDVSGYVGRCDEDAARAGIELTRERYRAAGRGGGFNIEQKSLLVPDLSDAILHAGESAGGKPRMRTR